MKNTLKLIALLLIILGFAACGTDNPVTPGDVIQFVLQRNTSEAFGVGSYLVEHVPTGIDDYLITFYYSGNGKNFQTIQGMSTGELNITKISGSQVEGTFSASLQDFSGNSMEITEGVFKSNKYGTFY